MSIQFSVTVGLDSVAVQSHLDFFADSENVQALGGYTLSFSISSLQDGVRRTLTPTAVLNTSGWDLWDVNLQSGSISAVS
jgi:hypothetical protein